MGEDWELNHVGLMVTNKNAVLRYLQSIGVGVSVGPQPLLPHEPGEGSLMYYQTLEGDPVTNTYQTGGAHTFNDGESQIGNCQLECISMKPGPGMFINEYLARQGPGINHICFNSASVEEDTQILVGKGFDIMFNALVNGRTVENYLDTRAHGDLMISLRPLASEWERAWKNNNESHPLVNDWCFKGVGVGVQDLDSTIEYYARMGFEDVSEERSDVLLGARSKAVKIGPLIFDFHEVSGENSIYQESIITRGDGVNDLIFSVPSLEEEAAVLESKGVELLRKNQDGSSVFFDTRKEGNIMLRLVQG